MKLTATVTHPAHGRRAVDVCVSGETDDVASVLRSFVRTSLPGPADAWRWTVELLPTLDSGAIAAAAGPRASAAT